MDSSNAEKDTQAMDALLWALAESRARFADSEARRAELEAVIQRLARWADEDRYKISGDHSTWTDWHQGIESAQEEVYAILQEVPSVVLEDRDRENRAIGWDEAVKTVLTVPPGLDGWTNPYRGDNR